MRRLFIAEKPSLAQAVAAVLPGSPRRDGVVTYVGDDVFVPLAGHPLEQAMPDEYLPDDVPCSKSGAKVWRKQDLPIVPLEWILNPAERMQRNIQAIHKLLREVDEVVHLGDPDAEGQLLVDEVLIYLENTKPVLRLLVNDYNESKVRQALNSLQSNDAPQFRAWYRWALARSHYDWLFGLNITRAATLRARELGYDGVLTVGSVQTPTLYLVAARDDAISTFVSVPYYTISAVIQHANGTFIANWKAGEKQVGLNESGKLVDEMAAHAVVARLEGQSAEIVAYEKASKRENAPLPFSLNELTVTACRKYGYTADEVLGAAQVLYDRYKITTYPRTENRYLSEAQHSDAPAVLAALSTNLPALADLIGRADPARKSAAFDDKKMEGNPHHGIVPTVCIADLGGLTTIERAVYELIVRSYIAQFFDAAVFMQTKIDVRCADERLQARGKTPVSQGWREVFTVVDEPAGDADSADDGKQMLPGMAQGDAAKCEQAEITARATKPLVRFDESMLIEAMTDLHKYTTDPAAIERLKAGNGIGTSATRAGIIKDLRERGFLELVKPSKTKLMCSKSGRGLLDALPMPVKDPKMAGMFKIALDAVATGQISYEEFIARHVAFVTKVVKGLETATMNLPMTACPKCTSGRLRRVSGSDGHFWGCSNFRSEPPCKASYPDLDGVPDFAPKMKPKTKGFGFKKPSTRGPGDRQ